MIQEYLQYIQEQGGRFKGPGKVNAPCFAYQTVYGKPCPQTRYGRYPGEDKKKPWGEYYVDEHLEDKWLKDLNSIKGIEIRSLCEGHDKDWVAYVVFRFKRDTNEQVANRVVEKLTKGITKAAYNTGNMGRVRFIVTAKTWYGQPDWKTWWSSISEQIKNSLGVVRM